MKKIHLSGLKQASKLLTEKALKARSVYDEWQLKIKELDGPKAKRDYTPVRLEELKTEARTDALRRLRAVKADMQITTEPALGQRSRWTKVALLREQRFANIPPGLALEHDRSYVVTTEQLNATRELSALIRASRLDDESLLEEIEAAVEVEDLPFLGVLASEARNRKSGGEMYKLRVDQAIKKLHFPEQAEAEKSFSEIERAGEEVAALEYALENPSSDFAQGHVSFFPAQRRIDERKAAEAAAREDERKAKAQEVVKLVPIPEEEIQNPFVRVKPEQSSAA